MTRYDRGVTRRVRLLSDLVAERDEILEEKVYLRGVHPPDKICTMCRAECGPSIAPQHDTLCDACAAAPADSIFVDGGPLLDMSKQMPGFDPEKFWADQRAGLEKKFAALQGAKLYGELLAADDAAREAYERPVPRFVATERTHAIDCDMDEDCTCGAEPCDHMTDDCTCPPDAP